MEIRKYATDADHRGVGLVAPEGVDSSFNAPHCCGTAKEQGIDDVGFIDSVVAELVAEGLADARAVSVTGFSNGGFMASHLVDPVSRSRTHWASVATAAGHEYLLSRTSPLPVAMHHCKDDSLVNASGCCAREASADLRGVVPPWLASSSTCCCGIESQSCVSVHQIFHRWATINECATFKSVGGPGRSRCKVGVGCTVPTSLCLYEYGCYHAQWSRDFPATAAVLDHLLGNGGDAPAARTLPGVEEAITEVAPQLSAKGKGKRRIERRRG